MQQAQCPQPVLERQQQYFLPLLNYLQTSYTTVGLKWVPGVQNVIQI